MKQKLQSDTTPTEVDVTPQPTSYPVSKQVQDRISALLVASQKANEAFVEIALASDEQMQLINNRLAQAKKAVVDAKQAAQQYLASTAEASGIALDDHKYFTYENGAFVKKSK